MLQFICGNEQHNDLIVDPPCQRHATASDHAPYIMSTSMIQQPTAKLQKEIDALNSKLGKQFMSEIKDFRSLANEQSVTCTINLTEAVEIGLVIYNIAHCGNGKNAGGYWDVSGLQSPGSRSIISIPCPSTWDSSITAVDILVNIGEGTRTLTFTNHTGVSTDSTYSSRVFATVIKLK